MPDEIKCDIGKIETLSETDKDNLVRLSEDALNAIPIDARRKSIILADKRDSLIKLTEINKSKNVYKTAEDMLNRLDINSNLKKELSSRISSGEVTRNYMQIICKLDAKGDLSKLDLENQKEIINKIIDNKQKENLIYSEEIACCEIKSGLIDIHITEKWYRNIIRLIEQLIYKFDINLNSETINYLGKEQRKNLSKLLSKLSEKINHLLRNLNSTL